MKVLNAPVKSLKFQDIVDFCKEKHIEGIQVDYKKDFPQKGLAKHFAAFSNKRGGIIIVGVEEDSKTGVPIKWEGIQNIGKLVDRVHQFASNVDPLPSYEVETTDEVNGKIFLLIRIFEGDKTPYYPQNDSNIWVRTGNISTPIDIASPDAQEILFEKREKAELARINNLNRAEDVYKAALRRGELKRKTLVAKENQEIKSRIAAGEIQSEQQHRRKYYNVALGEESSILTSSIQPYFPRHALTTPNDIRGKLINIRDYNSKFQLNFPPLGADPIPEGVLHFEWGESTGTINCDQLYSTGLITTKEDILRADRDTGRKEIYVASIGHQLFHLLKAADNFYSMFGYQGVLVIKVTLDGMNDIYVSPIASGGALPRGFLIGDRQSLFPSYEWNFQTDTSELHDEHEFQQKFIDIVKQIEWDMGFEDASDNLVKQFLEANHWLV